VHPLAGASDLSGYRLPDRWACHAGHLRETGQTVERYGKTHAVFGSLYQTIFEAAWLLRVWRPCSRICGDKEFAHQLFDLLLGYSLVRRTDVARASMCCGWATISLSAPCCSRRRVAQFMKEPMPLIAAFKAHNRP